MCVKYHIGNELPSKIHVTAIDAFGDKSIMEVSVDYERKPLICSGCKALGHLVSACPITRRIWVQRPQISAATENPPVPDVNLDSNCPPVVNSTIPSAEIVSTDASRPVASTPPWEPVKKKHAFSPQPSVPSVADDSSPTPLNTFKHLKCIDEIEGIKQQSSPPDLTKSQRKRLRKA